MAHRGQIIDNPVTGERIRFLRTAADTGGDLLEFEMELSTARTCIPSRRSASTCSTARCASGSG